MPSGKMLCDKLLCDSHVTKFVSYCERCTKSAVLDDRATSKWVAHRSKLCQTCITTQLPVSNTPESDANILGWQYLSCDELYSVWNLCFSPSFLPTSVSLEAQARSQGGIGWVGLGRPPALKDHFSANCSSAKILNIVRLWNRINKSV